MKTEIKYVARVGRGTLGILVSEREHLDDVHKDVDEWIKQNYDQNGWYQLDNLRIVINKVTIQYEEIETVQPTMEEAK